MKAKYGVKTSREGKYHLVANAETITHLSDPGYNCEPLNDAGLCGRLDAQAKYPHVLGRHSMTRTALCKYCVAIEAADEEIRLANRVFAGEITPEDYRTAFDALPHLQS